MADHSQMKLGRKAVKTDVRTLRLARYLTSSLPAAPAKKDWTNGVTNFGMMLNDTLGDCTIAGCGHAEQIWTLNIGPELTIADHDILSAYEAWDGYNPADPSTDQGGVELDVLKNFQQQGVAGHKILAFASTGVHNIDEVRQAINLFGGVYIGVSLPISAQSQDVWDAESGNDGKPGGWGGHCVFVPAYDAHGFTCITWGAPKKMTLAFWKKYAEESYALLSPDWVAAASPSGFALAELQADLALIQ